MNTMTTGVVREAREFAEDAHQLRLVTIPVAANLLGVSRSKLYDLLAEGELPTVRIGRARRIAVADLEAFVRRCRRLGSEVWTSGFRRRLRRGARRGGR